MMDQNEARKFMDCCQCWPFPKPTQYRTANDRKFIEFVPKRKYCWLYPQSEPVDEIEDKLTVKFDNFKSLYTKCDHWREKHVHSMILKLEKRFHDHEDLIQREMLHQYKLTQLLYEYGYRYLLLTQGSMCVKHYPEVVSKLTEQRATCDFENKRNEVKDSNCRLNDSLLRIKRAIYNLNVCCTYLDMDVGSLFIDGDILHKSLAQVREMIKDLFDCYCAHLCKLKRWAQLLDRSDLPSVEDYMALVNPFEDQGHSLMQDCKCRRAKLTNCLIPFKPC